MCEVSRRTETHTLPGSKKGELELEKRRKNITVDDAVTLM